MKKFNTDIAVLAGLFLFAFYGCSSDSAATRNYRQYISRSCSHTVRAIGRQDNESAKNIVQIAVGSKDHSTLVAAVKAADLVDALSNAGRFTFSRQPMMPSANYPQAPLIIY